MGSCFFLRTEITLQGATYQITFTDTDQLPPPFRVDNISEVNPTELSLRPRPDLTCDRRGGGVGAAADGRSVRGGKSIM